MKKKLTFSDKIKISGFHKQLRDIILKCFDIFKMKILAINKRFKNLREDPMYSIICILDNYSEINNFVCSLQTVEKSIEDFNEYINNKFQNAKKHLSVRKLKLVRDTLKIMGDKKPLIDNDSYTNHMTKVNIFLDKAMSEIGHSNLKKVFKILKNKFAETLSIYNNIENFFENSLVSLFCDAEREASTKQETPETHEKVSKPSDFMYSLEYGKCKSFYEKQLDFYNKHIKWLNYINFDLLQKLIGHTKNLDLNKLSQIQKIYLLAASADLEGDCMLPSRDIQKRLEILHNSFSTNLNKDASEIIKNYSTQGRTGNCYYEISKMCKSFEAKFGSFMALKTVSKVLNYF